MANKKDKKKVVETPDVVDAKEFKKKQQEPIESAKDKVLLKEGLHVIEISARLRKSHDVLQNALQEIALLENVNDIRFKLGRLSASAAMNFDKVGDSIIKLAEHKFGEAPKEIDGK